jgi:hypothetical protein
MQKLTLTLSDLTLVALSLDDPAMARSLDVEVRASKGWYEVIGGVEEIGTVVSDIHSRAYNDNDWDQPQSWERACKRAWTRIQKQLAQQGYTTIVSKHRYVIRVVPVSNS